MGKKENEEYQVFISWSNEKLGIGEELAALFVEYIHKITHLNVFSSHNVKSGDWASQVGDALKTCKFAIFLLTTKAVDSSWVSFELGALHVNISHYYEHRKNIYAFMFPNEKQFSKDKTVFKDLTYQIVEFNKENVKDLFNKINDCFNLGLDIHTLMFEGRHPTWNLFNEDVSKVLEKEYSYVSNMQLRNKYNADMAAKENTIRNQELDIQRLQGELEEFRTSDISKLQKDCSDKDAVISQLKTELAELKTKLEPQSKPQESFEIVVDGKSYGNMIYVKGGTFKMGSEGEYAFDDEKPVHEVSVSDYYICDLVVTQELWTAVMKSNPSKFQKGEDYPVECVTWYDAVYFCNKLSDIMGLKQFYKIKVLEWSEMKNGNGDKVKYISNALVNVIDHNRNGFRLPTEAEWEYAAKGGHKTDNTTKDLILYSGDHSGICCDISVVAWYGYGDKNDEKRTSKESTTMPVGFMKKNELGLYDMSGNVYEWCQDVYDSGFYKKCKDDTNLQPDPCNEGDSGSARVLRGGYWRSEARFCRVSLRLSGQPGDKDNGFRLSLSPQKK